MNPADRRPAMKVEDHPPEDASFEGIIPSGHYGAGSVEIWDKGGFTPVGNKPADKQLESGELVFTLRGKKLRGHSPSSA